MIRGPTRTVTEMYGNRWVYGLPRRSYPGAAPGTALGGRHLDFANGVIARR